MKTRSIFTAIIALCACVMFACSDVSRDNKNDPNSGKFSIKAVPDIATGSAISGHEDIVITFDISMNTATVALTGNMGEVVQAGNRTWSKTKYDNDTLTIKPNPAAGPRSLWPEGEGTLVVNGKCDCEGSTAMDEVTLAYTVENAVFVSSTADVTNPGDPANAGTRRSPLSVVQDGIDLADELYTTGAVRVAVGEYRAAYDPAVPVDGAVVSMVEGISIYGGYSSTFEERSLLSYVSLIEDTGVSNGTGTMTDPNRAIYCPATITNLTVIDGFTIKMGRGAANSSIFTKGSPTISNNIITGIQYADLNSLCYLQAGISIYLHDADNAIIKNNNIDTKYCYTAAGGCSYGIYIAASSPDINSTNTIDGGDGYDTYGIYIDGDGSSNPDIAGNTINAGGGSNICCCIHIYNGHPTISNNTFSRIGSNIIRGIYEELGNANPTVVTQNDFNYQGNWYYDNTYGQITYLNYITVKATIYGQTGNTTNTSAVITGIPDTSNYKVGYTVIGTGIPADTTVLSVDSSSQITLSASATATGTGISLTIGALLFESAGWDNYSTSEGINVP